MYSQDVSTSTLSDVYEDATNNMVSRKYVSNTSYIILPLISFYYFIALNSSKHTFHGPWIK